ncbi:alpha/beta hydrolase [Rhodanobacter umsongensis]|uniref:Alpha/beta hydrolase n=1 Tax=Rhodanobacter umsongensis TaxID=633153 RepID=A0ABW0JI82_9GAMM
MTMTIATPARLVRCACLILLCLPALALAGEPLTLHAADGVTVYGTLSQAQPHGRSIALLFHQAHANRHEYDSVVPALQKLGFDTLAIDQRSGGDLFDGHNETVAKLGTSADYLAALPDLEAALAWARAQHYARIVAVGSSYSSSLVIVLAAKHPQGLSAIASFSPGEYFDDKNQIKQAAARVTLPFYITTDPDEAGDVAEVLRDAHGPNVVHYQPKVGVHGASTLVAARDPDGWQANLASFTAFMRGLSPPAQ